MAIFGLFGKKKTKAKAQRSYSSANVGRLFSDFITSSLSADSEIKPALRITRDRCRESARNHPYSRRYLQILSTNVVGANGVRFQSQKRNPDGQLDGPGNRIVEQAWRDWSRAENCTVSGQMTFRDAQRLFIETWARDGEVLIRFIKNDPNNPYRFSLQFLESDYLDEDYNTRLSNGREVRMGVELDERGRPAAYYLFKDHPHDMQGFGAQDKRIRERIPAEDMLHIFEQERAGQTRGMPRLANVLSRIKMLDGYEEAELVAARVSASKMGFITSPAGDDYVGDGYVDGGNIAMDASPGTFEQLPAGMDVKSFDPDHPATAFAEFEKAILRGVASGLGISYVSLSNNLEGVSYSSIRQGVMEDRDHFQMVQRFMIERFIEPVYREWLFWAISSGQVNLPPYRYDEFANAATFRARGWNWIDPQKEINAAVTALNAGISTMQHVHGHHGLDTEEVFEQIDRERQLAERYNIDLAFQPFGDIKKAESNGDV